MKNILVFMKEKILEKDILTPEMAERIAPDVRLDHLSIDSLDMVDLGMDFEDEYGLELDEKELKDLKTFQDVEEYILNKIQEQKG